jgi:hypothetical protein
MKTTLSHRSISVCLLAGLAASALLPGCSGTRNSAMPNMGASKLQAAPAIAFQDSQSGAEQSMFTPSISQDARGNRIAVWEESDGKNFHIWAKRSVAGLGWGASRRLDAQNEGNAYSPRIAFDIQGNAMAVWEQQVGGRYKVWASCYEAGRGWGTARPIDKSATNSASDATAPQVALNALGEAMAVWQQSDGRHSHIRTSRFARGVGWGASVSVGDTSTHANAPQVAFDAQDIALVVWQQLAGAQTQVWASQRSMDGSWARAAQLSAEHGAGDAFNPTFILDPLGKAIALWQQGDAASSHLWARRFSAGAGWSASALVAPQVKAQIHAYQ